MDLDNYHKLVSSEATAKRYLSKNALKMDTDVARDATTENCTNYPLKEDDVQSANIPFMIFLVVGLTTAGLVAFNGSL